MDNHSSPGYHFLGHCGTSCALLSSFIRSSTKSTLCHGVVLRSRIPHYFLGKTQPVQRTAAKKLRLCFVRLAVVIHSVEYKKYTLSRRSFAKPDPSLLPRQNAICATLFRKKKTAPCIFVPGYIAHRKTQFVLPLCLFSCVPILLQ